MQLDFTVAWRAELVRTVRGALTYLSSKGWLQEYADECYACDQKR